MTRYHWTLLSFRQDVATIQSVLAQMAELEPQLPAMQRFPFLQALIDHGLIHDPMYLAVAYDGAQLKTALPLVLTRRHKWFWRWQEWCTPFSSHASIHVLPNCRDDEQTTIFNSLFAAAQQWPHRFERLALRWVISRSEQATLEWASESAWFELNGADEVDQVVSHKLHKNLLRLRKRLEAQNGKPEFHISPPGSIEGALQDFVDLEHLGWRSHLKQATIASDNHVVAAYKQFMHGFAELNQARVYRLTVGASLLAAAIGFQFGECIYLQSITFNQEYAEFAPGNQLLLGLLEHSVSTKNASVVTLSTCPEWCKRWHPVRYPVHNLVRFNNTVRGRLLQQLVGAWRSTKAWLKPLRERFQPQHSTTVNGPRAT